MNFDKIYYNKIDLFKEAKKEEENNPPNDYKVPQEDGDIENKKQAEREVDKAVDKKRDKDNTKDIDKKIEILDDKMIDMLTGEVEMTLSSIFKEKEYRINIKYLPDGKFTGYVSYNDEEDAKAAYENINTVGELMNYINIHAESDSSIYPALKILKKELIAIKRDYTPEEIAELALEFPI